MYIGAALVVLCLFSITDCRRDMRRCKRGPKDCYKGLFQDMDNLKCVDGETNLKLYTYVRPDDFYISYRHNCRLMDPKRREILQEMSSFDNTMTTTRTVPPDITQNIANSDVDKVNQETTTIRSHNDAEISTIKDHATNRMDNGIQNKEIQKAARMSRNGRNGEAESLNSNNSTTNQSDKSTAQLNRRTRSTSSCCETVMSVGPLEVVIDASTGTEFNVSASQFGTQVAHIGECHRSADTSMVQLTNRASLEVDKQRTLGLGLGYT